jgi:hypothetical protein
MLQNPRVAFRDPRLQQGRIEKDEKGQPRPWAGAFAVVYKGINADGGEPFAARVFTSESPERHERYDLISDYLKARRLKCLVDFEYRDRSIRSAGDGKWYPLIIMDWVQGETLFKWLRSQCLQGNGAAVAAVADRWVEVVKELGEASIAHGDLQHANVMITDAGEIKLVDYDCMCVPSLVGRRNLEVGVVPYQHPGRNAATLLSLDLDNFSALMIYVGLRALAIDPQLWRRYVEQPGYDKLLFRADDFRAPDQSALYHDLMQLPDEDVRSLVEQLFGLVQAPIDEVPSLGCLAGSYAKVERLLRRQQWDAAVKLLNRRGQFRDAPDDLKPLIREAYEHVCRQQAWTAFQNLPRETAEPVDRSLVQAWNEALFAGYAPAEQERTRVAEARRRVMLLDRLRHLLQQSSGPNTLHGEESIAEAAAQLPDGYRYGLQSRVEQARRSIAAIKRLASLFAGAAGAVGGDSSRRREGRASSSSATGVASHRQFIEADLVTAWRAVVKAKCEHLVDPAWRTRIELARQRTVILDSLSGIPEHLPADQRDQHILGAWQDDLLTDCPEADPWRPARQQALARKETLDRLHAAVDTRDEEAIVQWSDDPVLAGYPLPMGWTGSVRAAKERLGRREALVAALQERRREAFAGLFDARLIRRYADRFAPYQTQLADWTRAEALSLRTLGLGPAIGRASLVPLDDAPGSYRLRWSWPQARFADTCFLAICPDEPGPHDNPREIPAYFRISVDRQSWEAAGGSRVIATEPDWAGGCVVVWAVVDLGFDACTSPPLLLGKLPAPSRWNWKGWRVFSPRRGAAPRNQEEGEQT